MARAQRMGAPHADINAGKVHRNVGGYPGAYHRMPTCCNAMYEMQTVSVGPLTRVALPGEWWADQAAAPLPVKRAVPLPRRRPNAEYRTREHLTEKEVERLINAAKTNRYGHRDATMILVCYRHGLRASEACDLRRNQVN
jgi:Phage integrase family